MNAEGASRSARHAEIIRQVQRLLALAANRHGRSVPTPEVRFDLHGLGAGQYRCEWRHGRPRCVIRFNPEVFALDPERHLRETVAHEVAHHLTCHLHPGARPHGTEWAAWMHFFGVEPKARGGYRVDGIRARRQRRFGYRCGCEGVEHALSATRHNRVQRGVRYRCPRCGEQLKPLPASET